MTKLFLTLIVLALISIDCYSQQLLSKSYQEIKTECLNYNSQVSAIYYKESPVVLLVAKNKDLTEYMQTYMFSDQRCVSETQCYPASLFEKKRIYLTALYGEPGETMYGNNKMYVWRTNGMRITLTMNDTTTPKTTVAQINYAKDSDIEAIVDVSQKIQTPFTKSVTLKSE